MDEAKVHEIRQWLIKAHRDLGSARRLLEGDPSYADTAVFHCQQAAEKSVKAYLTFKDSPFEKIHDLRLLVQRAAAFDVAFNQLADAAETLTPYAVAFRYPGDVLEPARGDAEEALRLAKSVLNFVLQRMPAETKEELEG